MFQQLISTQKADESPRPSVTSCSFFDNPQTFKGNKLFFNILLPVFLLCHKDIGQNITFLPSPSPTQAYDPGFLLHFYCSISISTDHPRTVKKKASSLLLSWKEKTERSY